MSRKYNRYNYVTWLNNIKLKKKKIYFVNKFTLSNKLPRGIKIFTGEHNINLK